MKNQHSNNENCPICGRFLNPKGKVDDHHLIPKSKGGRYSEKIKLHRICHDKIHSIWSTHELRGYYHTVERIVSDERMVSFIKWVSKKPDTFYVKTKREKGRR